MKKGLKLSEATAKIRQSLGLKIRILPMTDDRFETWIKTDSGSMHFQEYLVRRGARDTVLDVKFVGAETAKPAPQVIETILDSRLVIVCPSNPIVSIGTILSIKGVRDALIRSKARKIAISPIVAGGPIKGPADKLMRGLGLEVSPYSVAHLYRDFLDTFVLDEADQQEKPRIEELGIKVVVTDTIMRSLEDKVRLAKTVLEETGRWVNENQEEHHRRS